MAGVTLAPLLGVCSAALLGLVVLHVVRYVRGHRVWDASGGMRSDPRLVDLIDDMPALVWTTDRRLRLTGSIGGGLHLLGLPTDGVRKMPLVRFFEELGPGSGLAEAHRRALSGETIACSFGAGRRMFRGVVRPLRHDGRIVGVAGMATEELVLIPEASGTGLLGASDQIAAAFFSSL